MAGALPQPTGATQALALGLKYGPNAGAALQRSQYLADALERIQTSAAQNSRTPASLMANLLAEGLTAYSSRKADKDALAAYAGDQRNEEKGLFAGTPLDESAPPAPQPPPAPAPEAPPQALAEAVGGAPTPQPAGQINYSPSDREALARMIAGEARGEGPDGMAAAGSVALNRLQHHYRGAKSLADVVYAPHQFSGMDQGNALPPGQMAPAYQVADGLLSGQVPDPTHGATSFLNPTLQVQQGHAIPAWAQGQGQQIGHHVFYGGSPQAEANAEMASHQLPQGAMSGGGDPQHPPQAPQLPGGGTLAYTPPQQQAPGPQPYQIASNGPTPPPPSSPAGAAPAAPSALPGPAAGAGVPHQVVTPEEWQTAAALLHDPRTRELGVQELIKLKMRAAAPVEDPSKPYWGNDGQAHYAPGTQNDVRPGQLPGTYIVTTPQHDVKVVTEPNLTNGPPPGYDRDPTNPNRLILQGTGAGLPVPGHSAAQAAPPQAAGPDTKAQIPPALQKAYMDTLDAYHKGPGYTDYVNSVNAANALEANLKAALGNNTIVDQTGVDATIRAMTGLSARQGSVNAIIEHLPWSEQLKGFIAHAIGPDGMNGYITPKVMQQLRTAVHAYADGHRQLAEQEYAGFNSGANRMGFDLGQSLPTVKDMGPVKWLDQPSAPAAANPADPLVTLPNGSKIPRSQLHAYAKSKGWVQ